MTGKLKTQGADVMTNEERDMYREALQQIPTITRNFQPKSVQVGANRLLPAEIRAIRDVAVDGICESVDDGGLTAEEANKIVVACWGPEVGPWRNLNRKNNFASIWI